MHACDTVAEMQLPPFAFFQNLKNAGVRQVTLPLAAWYATAHEMFSKGTRSNVLGEETSHLEQY